jgi:ASC-1-like (ASCH) protein
VPLFFARKEVFEWLAQGKKTIDIRKGSPHDGEIAVFQSGPRTLRLRIVKKESGRLEDILRFDNFRAVIPSALELEDAVDYLQKIYGLVDGIFTAYYVGALLASEKGKLNTEY